MSSLMPMTPVTDDNIVFSPPHMKGCGCRRCLRRCTCDKCKIEEFGNDELYEYKSSVYSDYRSVPLLPKNDDFNNPESLLFGHAKRFIYMKDDIKNINFDIYCNLLVLDGNVYGESKRVNQKYKVYLINDKTKSKIERINQCKKDFPLIHRVWSDGKDEIVNYYESILRNKYRDLSKDEQRNNKLNQILTFHKLNTSGIIPVLRKRLSKFIENID